MIGPVEIVILLVILLLVFGRYLKLPQLGRSAGKGVRRGGEKAKELASTASSKAESIDTERLARSAGDGLREVKELREAVTGSGSKGEEPEAVADDRERSAGREPQAERERSDDG